MIAQDILQSAIGHMDRRAIQYDKPGGERSMEKTIAAFNALTGRDLKVGEGWLLMVMLKLVRAQTAKGAALADSLEDCAAYVALMGEPALAAHAREVGEA